MATKQVRIDSQTVKKLMALAQSHDCSQKRVLEDAVNCFADITGMIKQGYVLCYKNPNAPEEEVQIHFLGYSKIGE